MGTAALSPGGQNTLIKQMLEEFCPRYAPGGQVLYVGDADEKWAVFHPLTAKTWAVRFRNRSSLCRQDLGGSPTPILH